MRSAKVLGCVLLLWASSAQAQEMEHGSKNPPNLVAKKLNYDVNRLTALSAEQTVLAREIGRDLVCLCGTCPKEPIADCTCGWASMNRKTIQKAVAEGMPREKLLALYREAYGDSVLAMLPNEGFARAAWLLPYTAAVVSFGLVLFMGFRYLRRSKRIAEDVRPAPVIKDEARDELSRELDELD